jgi:hypothetical protein
MAVAASGVGFGAAAVLTPTMTRRFGLRHYLAGLALLGTVMQIFPLALFTSWAIAVSAFGLGLVTQGIKICVDTTLQRIVGDVFLGRVFSIYDVLLNVALVVATVIAALVMPTDGRSIASSRGRRSGISPSPWSSSGSGRVRRTGWSPNAFTRVSP